jgi:heterodisulfide reductase subunit B2
VKYAYYPGCSLECNALAYDVSVREVAERLGIALKELDDWNCCGATEYFSQEELTAAAVVARNLALVEPDTNQLVAPCAACYCNLIKIDRLMTDKTAMGDKINQALAAGNLHYEPGRVKVRHMLDVIYEDVGEAGIREKTVRPLAGLKIAPYYGCQVVRPITAGDSPEYPMRMDELFTWLGAEVIDYPVKAHCCGGHMTQISENQAFELIYRLVQCAVDGGADMILCACPMCQLNLDAYQDRVAAQFKTNFHMPVLYFTQVLGLALGIDAQKLGFGKEIVSAEPVIKSKLRPAALETSSLS